MNISEFKIKCDKVKQNIESQITKYVLIFCNQNSDYNGYEIKCHINKSEDGIISITFDTFNAYSIFVSNNGEKISNNICHDFAYGKNFDEIKDFDNQVKQVEIIEKIIKEDVEHLVSKANMYYDMDIDKVINFKIVSEK